MKGFQSERIWLEAPDGDRVLARSCESPEPSRARMGTVCAPTRMALGHEPIAFGSDTHQSGAAAKAELFHRGDATRVHRLKLQAQRHRDFGVGLPISDQLGYGQFARGQFFNRRWGGRSRRGAMTGDGRIEIGVAVVYDPDGVDQILGCAGFDNVTTGAGCDHFFEITRFAIESKADDFRFGLKSF